MGWSLWSSAREGGAAKPTDAPSNGTPPAQSSPPPLESANASSRPQPKPSTVEQELSAYLPVFASPEEQESDNQIKAPPIVRDPDDGFEVAYPDTMSCREAFDAAYYCQTMGGQMMNVYRYGERRSCKDHWSQFWFCMRTRQKKDEVKRELIQEFYRKKEEKYMDGPSSEDVWEPRKEKVKEAFHLDLRDVVHGDSTKKYRYSMGETGGRTG